LKVLLFPKN